MEIVEFSVVGFDALQKQITCLLQEWVDREIHIEVRIERQIWSVSGELSKTSWKFELLLSGFGRDLVEEGGHEVRVVNNDWQFDEDIFVAELRLLHAVNTLVWPDMQGFVGHTFQW